MITNCDINHTGEYRLQLVTANDRKAGHEYLPTKELALKRLERLKKHGYRVRLYLVDHQGDLQYIL